MFWSTSLKLCVSLLIIYCNIISVIHYVLTTSSTAQGGGGSFKNGKPIGEVSWCDAKIAERTHWWIERWLSVSPFLSLFLSFSLCLSFAIYLQSYLSSHLPIYLSIHVSIDRRLICLFTYLLNCLSFYPAIHPSTYFSLLVFFSVHLFIDPCPQLSITMFFVLFLYRFIHASVRLPLLPATVSIHLSSYPCVYLVIDASSDLSI